MGVNDNNMAFLLGGDDKGIVVKVVMRATKKAGLLLLSPSLESPPAPVVVGVGVGGAGVGGARGGSDVRC